MQIVVLGNLKSEISKAIEIAKQKGAKVFFTSSFEDCLTTILGGKSADLLLVDIVFDIKLLSEKLKEERINANIVAYGLNSSPKEAVNAIKSGAKEFIPLPPNEELIAAILEKMSFDEKSLIYKSSAMEDVITIANKVADTDAHILITGESGTGKEVLSSMIHYKSSRSTENFVRVNCAAIPENLLESELFGHEKGAFTGANSRKIGKFEQSSRGTLLLDEISEMDIKLQSKLLRAIQEKEVDRLGGNNPIKVDLRLIATSNRDMLNEVSKGKFREDLYFRLNVINIDIPPLRKRQEDILPLAEFFLEKYCNANNYPLKTISSDAIKTLANYNWPGNARELENTIHRAVLLSANEITSKDLALKTNQNTQYSENNNTSEEKKLILNTLNYCLGDINQAANILGISIRNLTEKLEKTCK